MQPNRRDFFRQVGCLTAAGSGLTMTGSAGASQSTSDPSNSIGVLVDTTMCVGCRLCEYACKKSNGYEAGELASYDTQQVFGDVRRPGPRELTVVNAWKPDDGGAPVYAKINCMHCNHCACASACIVGALKKQPNGAVTYDESKCIGCRYCMVACPFQLPAYSYEDVLTPKVYKCQFCFDNRTGPGKDQPPACVEACPKEALTFGKRTELVELAHERIEKNPEGYVDQVYGEKELGGTAWMYLSRVPFEQIGFQKFGHDAPPATTEKIQSGMFSPKLGVPPLLLAGVMTAMMYVNRARKKVAATVRPSKVSGTAAEASPVAPSAASDHPTPPATPAAVVEATPEGAPVDIAKAIAAIEGKVEEPTPAPVAAQVAESHAAHQDEQDHHEEHDEEPRPVNRTLFTPGVILLALLTLVGIGCYLYRFLVGIGASTNMNQQRPWGLWIGIDVGSGVALAVGGFTSVVLARVFNRKHYEPIVRPAMLTAMLGYTVVVTGLLADLGRFYNVWHPLVPTMWSPTSVLFMVGICEVLCINLLWVQFSPFFIEKLERDPGRFPRLLKYAKLATPWLHRFMPAMLALGIVANLLHQTALGNLLVITPYKLHPLWYTPWLGAMFLVSAVATGFPMILWESLFASWSLKLKPEMHVLTKLAKLVPPMLGTYLVMKVIDVIWRGAYVHLSELSPLAISWWVEVIVGLVVPIAMLMTKRVRTTPWMLFTAATMVIGGLILNRMNVFVMAYTPPFGKPYFPSFVEIGVTVGLMSALILGYRIVVTFFPVISQPKLKPEAKPEAKPSASIEMPVALPAGAVA